VLLFNLIIRINPFCVSLLCCHDTYGILAGFASEDVFLLKENYINIEDGMQQPLMKRGIDADCAVILYCVYNVYNHKIKQSKLDMATRNKEIIVASKLTSS
jgi:hypothetical protein